MDNKKLTLGTEVRITGGKYKRLVKGILKTLKPTYCDVEFVLDDGTKATHKVKVDYIFPTEEVVVEMPDAEDLADVQQDPDDFIKENPDLMKDSSDEEPVHPDDEEFDNLADAIALLEGKAKHWMDESNVFEAERDQADHKVQEQDVLIKKLQNRNTYLEEICARLLC